MKYSKNVFKKKHNRENAITLISLVITIVIMVILVGVVISNLTTDNGLISRTREISKVYNDGVWGEKDQIDYIINMSEYSQISEKGFDYDNKVNSPVLEPRYDPNKI